MNTDVQSHIGRKKTTRIIVVFLLLLVIAVTGVIAVLQLRNTDPDSVVTTFDECATAKGSSILELYPEICVTREGVKFTRHIYSTDKPQPTIIQTRTYETAKTLCEQNNWLWLSEHSECEQMRPETCEQAGGQYNECESSCRHNLAYQTGEVACIQVCVPVCKFSSTK
jgi:hypothetical protein